MSHWVMSHVGRLTGVAGPLLAASAVCSAAAVQAVAAPEVPLGSRPFSAGIIYPSPEAVVGAQVSSSQPSPSCTPWACHGRAAASLLPATSALVRMYQ